MSAGGVLVGEELVHGGDLGVVAGEGEFGQVPVVLDGAQQRVMVVGDVLTKWRGPLGSMMTSRVLRQGETGRRRFVER